MVDTNMDTNEKTLLEDSLKTLDNIKADAGI
jgi:hypothetical protein